MMPDVYNFFGKNKIANPSGQLRRALFIMAAFAWMTRQQAGTLRKTVGDINPWFIRHADLYQHQLAPEASESDWLASIIRWNS